MKKTVLLYLFFLIVLSCSTGGGNSHPLGMPTTQQTQGSGITQVSNNSSGAPTGNGQASKDAAKPQTVPWTDYSKNLAKYDAKSCAAYIDSRPEYQLNVGDVLDPHGIEVVEITRGSNNGWGHLDTTGKEGDDLIQHYPDTFKPASRRWVYNLDMVVRMSGALDAPYNDETKYELSFFFDEETCTLIGKSITQMDRYDGYTHRQEVFPPLADPPFKALVMDY